MHCTGQGNVVNSDLGKTSIILVLFLGSRVDWQTFTCTVIGNITFWLICFINLSGISTDLILTLAVSNFKIVRCQFSAAAKP